MTMLVAYRMNLSIFFSIFFALFFSIPRSATATVFVSLLDRNDECPTFESTSYNGEITRQDVFVLKSGNTLEPLLVIAQDGDSVSFCCDVFSSLPDRERFVNFRLAMME